MPPSKHGYVYIFFTEGNIFKIGHARNVQLRLSVLSTSCPFRLDILNEFFCADCKAVEQELHAKFSHKRLHGEWFALNDSEARYLEWVNEEKIINKTEFKDEYSDNFDPLKSQVEYKDLFEYWLEGKPLWGKL